LAASLLCNFGLVFIDQPEAAFEQLKPELALIFRPNIAGLGKAREQSLDDRIRRYREAKADKSNYSALLFPNDPLCLLNKVSDSRGRPHS
jgi:hypothetical protein